MHGTNMGEKEKAMHILQQRDPVISVTVIFNQSTDSPGLRFDSISMPSYILF